MIAQRKRYLIHKGQERYGVEKNKKNMATNLVQKYFSYDTGFHVFNFKELAKIWKCLAKYYKGKISMRKVLSKAKLFWALNGKRCQIVCSC